MPLLKQKLTKSLPQILKTLVNNKASISSLDASSLNNTTIAALTEGYLPADLRDLVDRAIHQSAIRASSRSQVALSSLHSLSWLSLTFPSYHRASS